MIKTRREYKKVYKSVVDEASNVLGISRDLAATRVNALLDSGLLDLFDGPDDPKFQRVADMFMQIEHDSNLPVFIEMVKDAVREGKMKS